MIQVRPYRPADEGGVLIAWNAALVRDPVDPPTFRRKVLLDVNFDPEGLLVADDDGCLVGFCLGLVRRAGIDTDPGLQPEHGWITAFGVHPQAQGRGAGAALLEATEGWLGGKGRTTVSLAPYVPNYFVPGVDVEAYAGGLAFLKKRGFDELDRPISMDANITLLDLEPHLQREAELGDRGIEVRTMAPHEIPALLAMLQAHMPPDWVRHARQLLVDISRGQAGWDQLTVAVRRATGELVGYCQFEDEHFGPFGVIEAEQGRGIGTVLLARCLRAMQRRGLHNAWVLWTSDHTGEHVYGRFGFAPTRRFAVLRKTL